ncbi:hypothetical protein HDK64DRAFT_280874 [Phyllosticta capitalensis]
MDMVVITLPVFALNFLGPAAVAGVAGITPCYPTLIKPNHPATLATHPASQLQRSFCSPHNLLQCSLAGICRNGRYCQSVCIQVPNFLGSRPLKRS